MRKVYMVAENDGPVVAVFRYESEAYFYVERSGVGISKKIENKLDLFVKEMPIDPDWTS